MKKQFSADKHCGAKRRSGGRCAHMKGFKTDHVGQGKCYLHGGRTPIKHGGYSSITRPTLRKLMDEIAKEQNPLDLLQDVILLRALVSDFANRYDELNESALVFKESYSAPVKVLLTSIDAQEVANAIAELREVAKLRPAQILDVQILSVLVDRVGRMVERIQKSQSEGTITRHAVVKLQEQMALVVARHVQAEAMQKIEDGWNAIVIEVR